MTVSFSGTLENVVIAQGGTSTRWIYGPYEYDDANAIVIQSPEALDAGTYSIEVSSDGVTGATLTDAGGDLSVPAGGDARQYTEMLGARYFRIVGPSAASARTFRVTKQWTI